MKSKRFLTVLLSLAIMFTFMPTMAFANAPAGTKATFNGDYTKVSVAAYTDADTGQEVPAYTYNTVRTYNADYGFIEVTPDPAADVDWAVPSGDDFIARYYDLSVAEFADANGKTLKAEYTWGGYTKGSMTYVKLNVPSYVTNKTATPVVEPFNYLKSNWTAKAVGDEEYDAEARIEQTFTLSLEGTYNTNPDDGRAIVGTILAKSVKVNAPAADPAADAKYYFDDPEAGTTGTGASKTNPMAVYYDGEAHTFMASAVDGWTASYSVFDAQSGKFNPATAVTVSEILKDPTYVKVEWTKSGDTAPTAAKTRYFYVNLKKAGLALVGFKEGEKEFGETVYTVPGTEYDAASYIDAVANVTYNKNMPEQLKPDAKLLDAATEKAVAKNKAALIAYFNDLYEIKAEVAKSNPNVVELSVESKDLTSKERTAIAEKYADLLACLSVEVGEDEAVVALNGVDLTDYEIEFVEAPAKKVIKTKKAKSTKKVTFNVKAECKNGTVVKYKLINAPKKNITIDANTGKITVKKGTPKGTYTFKVKAYVPGSYNYYERIAVSEVQTIKVIVKKTKK